MEEKTLDLSKLLRLKRDYPKYLAEYKDWRQFIFAMKHNDCVVDMKSRKQYLLSVSIDNQDIYSVVNVIERTTAFTKYRIRLKYYNSLLISLTLIVDKHN
jgi:hypothetical protein